MPDADKRLRVEVSAGELFDRITVLRLKAARLASSEGGARVRAELESLERCWRDACDPAEDLLAAMGELSSINESLWRAEDDIRLLEDRGQFGPQFVDVARSICRLNDRRAGVKRRISTIYGSASCEEKVYQAV
jgi:hypothetical protein